MVDLQLKENKMKTKLQDNSNKIILDLCGGTGAWSKPYKENGFDVRVITLPVYDVMLYNEYKKFIKQVYGILAAPTCTMFSMARTTAKTPRDLKGGFKLVERCLHIIHDCRLNGNLKFWALENPVGYLRQLLGKPPLTFNPADFGDGYTKKTDLWGYYNFPKKNPVPLTPQAARDCSINNRVLPEIPKEYILPPDLKRQAVRRSITPTGFANAFYKANK